MTRYQIDPARSRVWIDARSNVHPIHTEAEGLEGWIDLSTDESGSNGPNSSGHLEFGVDNLKSGNMLEHRELQRRIDARKYPTIAGDLRVMKPNGDGAPYLVSGDLTFRGVTRSYDNEMTVEGVGGPTITLEGEATFDIRDFGMEPPRILLLKVYPDVKVRVQIVADATTEPGSEKRS